MSILKLYSRSNSTVGQSLLPDWQSVFYLPLAARRAVYAPGHQRWKKEHFNCKNGRTVSCPLVSSSLQENYLNIGNLNFQKHLIFISSRFKNVTFSFFL